MFGISIHKIENVKGQKLGKAKTSIKKDYRTSFMEQLYRKAKLNGSIKQISLPQKMEVML